MFAFIDFVVFLGIGLAVVLMILNKLFGGDEPVLVYIDEDGEIHIPTDDKGNFIPYKKKQQLTNDEGILAYIDKDGEIHILTDDEGNFILYKRETQDDKQGQDKKVGRKRR